MVKFSIVKLSDIKSSPNLRLDAKYWVQKNLLKERRKNGNRKTSMDWSTKVQTKR